MDPLLSQLLSACHQEDEANRNGVFTHMTFFGPRAHWNIKPVRMSEFWTGYCSIVQGIEDGSRVGRLPLAERVPDQSPVLSDCVFRFHEQNDSPEELCPDA